jgi:uncharacterized membrane protein YkvI
MLLAVVPWSTLCVVTFVFARTTQLPEKGAVVVTGVLSTAARLWISGRMLVVWIFIASRFGLVTRIASGYGALAYVFLSVFVTPLLTFGLCSSFRRQNAAAGAQPCNASRIPSPEHRSRYRPGAFGAISPSNPST